MAETILGQILAHKRDEIKQRKDRYSVSDLQDFAKEQSAARGFARTLKSLVSARQTAVIAEIKRASPSKGVLREPFEPLAIARDYMAAGAACLSVLTDNRFFRGSGAILDLVRRHCPLPALRKDFIIDPYQLHESKAVGADAVLLIAAALPDDGLLRDLLGQARELGMDVLAEVHDEAELARVLQPGGGPELIGVNNRDLNTFEVSLETSLRLAAQVPGDKIVVSESGIHTGDDIRRLRDGRVYACLVGEALMTAENPGDKLRELLA